MQPPLQYAPGQVLPGTVYRVVRHLATGGMGSVYDVEDVSVEKRYVLKTLHPQLISREDLARRMRDEAKALAKLHHPNIVDVITAGITSDAVKMPFYVMERLNGQNLRVVLEKKSALDVSHSYRIAIDVADALEHAHENQIIHRDVKPENIFLHRNSNGTTTTKLLDFGIVRLLDRKASHTHGKFIGTLRYASPEQITGGPLGPATDIYSLGVVLFEMLAGCGPFDNMGDAYAIGAAHANQIAPPVSRFVRVGPEVERLVASALAKNPEQRPRDCFAFASELRRLLRDEEAAPRSATMANVLSAAVPPTNAGIGTDPTSAVESSGRTALGMIPPSGGASTAPATRKEGQQYADDDRGPVSPIAPTLAVAEGFAGHMAGPHGPHGPYAPPGNVQVNFAQQEPHKRPIDRSAPTRESAPVGWTQRLAPNDTRIEDGLDPHAQQPPQLRQQQQQHHHQQQQHLHAPGGAPSDDAMRAAFGEQTPLIIMDAEAHPPHGTHPHSNQDIVFPPNHGMSHTGPLAGEAQTRPPERGPFILIGVAAVLSIALVGGALALVHARSKATATPAPTTSVPIDSAALSTATSSSPIPSSSSSSSSSSALASASPSNANAPVASAEKQKAELPSSSPISPTTAAPTPTTTQGRTTPGSRPTSQPAPQPHHASSGGADPKPAPTPSGHAPPVKFEP